MDQLSRGVKVEGLTLPPGITLTRVDPNKADNLRANKESINRVRFGLILRFRRKKQHKIGYKLPFNKIQNYVQFYFCRSRNQHRYNINNQWNTNGHRHSLIKAFKCNRTD